MGNLSKGTGFFIGIMLLIVVAFSYYSASQSATGAAADDVRISGARDFLFAYQADGEDAVLVTAQLFKGGQPLKQAGVPVNFSLSDGRYAVLDDTRVYTDEWGMASTRVRSYNPDRAMSDRPFLLGITAEHGGKSALLTLSITHYIPLNGTVKDKNGSIIPGAQVAVLYDRTRQPVSAMGTTTLTDIRGNYRLERVPTDLGPMVVYAKKGDLEAYTTASF